VKYYYMSVACLCALEAFCFGGAANAQTIEGTQSQAPLDAVPGAVSASNTGSDANAGQPNAPSPTAASAPLLSTVRHFSSSIRDGDFTLHGITLYGGIDLGVGYQSHGNPFNGEYGPGRNYLISKDSNGSQFGAAPNALSYSNIGLRGSEPILPGLSAIFNVNTTFNPYSGMLSNNLDTLVQNNGVALNRQISGGDSSRNGQLFNSYSYLGLSSPTYGTLTFGRQNSLPLDAILEYDPLQGSNAFSVIGYQGATAGGGSTEDARLDSVVKYRVVYGRYHFGALASLGNGDTDSDHSAYQFDAGAKFGRLSFDGVFSEIDGAVSASSLTAYQVQTEPVNSLSATISDNTDIMGAAKYSLGATTLFAGYAHIGSSNPHDAGDAPFSDDGFAISVVNDNGFPHQKVLQVFWTGAQYKFNSKLDFAAAYYQELQNSYGVQECHTSASPTCSGSLEAVSFLADYHFTKLVDSYFGAMYSTVSDGLASGYLSRSTIDPTVGLRIQF
jgi:predicted porin